MSDNNENVIEFLKNQQTATVCFSQQRFHAQALDMAIKALSENKGECKHGHWLRMSSEDKDDRYKCSRCGNVVHYSNGGNLYTFNSWCGRCGSLNNSLLASLEPYKAESEEE